MDTPEKIALLRERFCHDAQLYALQQLKDDGQAPYYPAKVNEDDYRELADQMLVAHLKGGVTLGLYQLDHLDRVKWLCLDVDVNKGADATLIEAVQQHVLGLARQYRKHGIPFLVEGSGRRGLHLWTFFAEPAPARQARALGLFLAGLATSPEGTHVEVYPKQVQRAGKRLGNLVKLPLGIHRKSGNRCLFVDATFAPHTDQWAALAGVGAMGAADLDRFLADHEVPLPQVHQIQGDGLVGALTPPCFVNVRGGVAEGGRDVIAFRYACYMRDRGLDDEEASAALDVWNARNDPPLPDAILAEKVRSAFDRAYSPFPCSEEAFDPYCSPDCAFYEKKMLMRGRAVRA